MNNSIVRLTLVLLFLLLGILLQVRVGFEAAWYLYAAGALLALTHLLFGTVWSAFYYLRRGKIDRAEKLIQQVISPHLLIRRHRAYYFFVRGMIALQKNALEEAEQDLEQALQLRLQSDKDVAIACLNLAHIAYVQKDPEKCRKHLAKAKQMETSDLLIKENIQKLEKALEQ